MNQNPRVHCVFVGEANGSAKLQLDDARQTRLQNCASKRLELGEDRVQIKGETEISSDLFFFNQFRTISKS